MANMLLLEALMSSPLLTDKIRGGLRRLLSVSKLSLFNYAAVFLFPSFFWIFWRF